MTESGSDPELIKPTVQESPPQIYQPRKTNWFVVFIIIAVIILSGGAYIFLSFFQKGRLDTNSKLPTANSLNATNVLSSEDQASAIKGWQTFDNFRQALKNHDIATYNQLVAVPESFCKTESVDCTQFMDSSYDYLGKYQQSDFVNAVEDNKQLALWNNPVLSLGNQYTAIYLYFTKNSTGDLDFLSMDNKTFYSASEQEAKLQAQDMEAVITKDEDNNGYWDLLDKIWNDKNTDLKKIQNNTTTPSTTTTTTTNSVPYINNPSHSSFVVTSNTDQVAVRFDYYFQMYVQAQKTKDSGVMIKLFGKPDDFGQQVEDFKDEGGIFFYNKYVLYKYKITKQNTSSTFVKAYYVVPDKKDDLKFNILIFEGSYNDSAGTARILGWQFNPQKYSTKEQIDEDLDLIYKVNEGSSE